MRTPATLSQGFARCLQGYGEDDYVLFDCPGQIELYSHCTVFRSFVEYLRRDGWSVAAVYCIDCQFVAEPAKFVAGALQVAEPFSWPISRLYLSMLAEEMHTFLLPL